MYFITVLSLRTETHHGKTFKDVPHCRCMGYRIKLEDAIGTVKTNAADIHECSFTYAVIEKYGEGMYADPEEIQWYIWEGDDETGGYKECERPEPLKKIISFGIG